MADGGSWFKLWCSALDDEALDNLSVENFGRWAKLGAYVKKHGTAGSIDIAPPARTLCAMLQVNDFTGLVAVVALLPNVEIIAKNSDVTGVTIATVTFRNWLQYQGDNSADRVRRWRARVTPEKRREEKRTDQSRTTPPSPLAGGERPARARRAAMSSDLPADFEAFWLAYPQSRRRGRQEALQAWRRLKLTPAQVQQVMASLESWTASEDWRKQGGKYIPWPQKFLNRGRWQETVEPGRDLDELPRLNLGS